MAVHFMNTACTGAPVFRIIDLLDFTPRLYPETCPSDLILRLLGLLPRSGIAIALATVVV
jgi:hypothetical protein